MKILQINSVANSGSTGRIAEGIGLKVIEHGNESFIAYGRWAMKSNSRLIKIGGKCSILIHGIVSRIFDNHGFLSSLATKKFIKEIDRINPDIIHLHNIHGYYINIKLLFKYLAKVNKPIVWTLHDCWAFTGHCSYFDFVGCDKWKEQCYSCPNQKEYPKSILFDNSKRNYKKKKELFTSVDNMTIVPVSYWLEDLVKESFLRKYPTKVIQNGIDINAFNIKDSSDIAKKYDLEGKFVILGVASVWTKRKGLEDFIKLSMLLNKEEIIVLVGLSKEQIKMLPHNIIGIERTESVEELAKLYSISNVFVNPTYEDNFPTTNLEALACGTPVITYKTGGSIESIDENVGYIVDKGDIKSLILIIKRLKQETELQKEQRQKVCRYKAEKLYDKEIKFEEYIELYKKAKTVRDE